MTLNSGALLPKNRTQRLKKAGYEIAYRTQRVRTSGYVGSKWNQLYENKGKTG